MSPQAVQARRHVAQLEAERDALERERDAAVRRAEELQSAVGVLQADVEQARHTGTPQ